MNHEYINKFNVIDQYVLGRLTANEAEEFEDHFIDCPTCVEQLNTTRDLVQDLKSLAVQETLVLERESVRPTRGWSLKEFVPNRLSVAIALGCIVAAGVLTFLALRRVTQLEAELRQTKEAGTVVRQEYQSSLENAAESARQLEEARHQLAQRVDELERKLKEEDGRHSPAVRSSEGSESNFPIFALASVARGQGPAPTEIVIPLSSPRFAFSIPVEDTSEFSFYRVTIVNQRGRTVLQQSGFRPDQYRSLSLSLSSNLLAPGTYDLRVEGLKPPNEWSTVGSYPFRFTRRR
jgi:hypothetical protein